MTETADSRENFTENSFEKCIILNTPKMVTRQSWFRENHPHHNPSQELPENPKIWHSLSHD